MFIYLNNYFSITILFIVIYIVLYKLIRQRRRLEVNILKMIKELEDKLIKI